MSRLDVLRSLLHSSARSAAKSLRNLPGAEAFERTVQEASLGRVPIPDAQLTAAVAQLEGVVEATVSSRQGRMRIDVAFDDGHHLSVALRPAGVQFAPGGAKELAFDVEPAELRSPRLSEVVAAIGGQVACAAFRPVVARAPRARWTPHAMREGNRLIVDLRSVPEVRWALSRRWGQAAIELIRIRDVAVDDGGLALSVGLERLAPR